MLAATLAAMAERGAGGAGEEEGALVRAQGWECLRAAIHTAASAEYGSRAEVAANCGVSK